MKKLLPVVMCMAFLASCAHTQTKKRAEYVGTCNTVFEITKETLIETQKLISDAPNLKDVTSFAIEFNPLHKCISETEVLMVMSVHLVFNDNGEKLCGSTDWLLYSKLDKDDVVEFELIEQYNERVTKCAETVST